MMARHMWKNPPFRVLLDMDCVMADFEGNFLRCFREKFPHEPFIPLEERKNFYVSDDYRKLEEKSPGILPKTRAVFESPGFFRSLSPIQGSIDAAKEMSSMKNVEVFLCTSPLSKTPGAHYDVSEKVNWVEEHLGNDWVNRVIISKDKTMVLGDLLIDDRPKVTGIHNPPTWKHILFTAHHNRHLNLAKSTTAVERLDNWTDGSWRLLIEKYQKKV